MHQQHMENDYPSTFNEQLPSTPQSINDSHLTGVLHSPIVSCTLLQLYLMLLLTQLRHHQLKIGKVCRLLTQTNDTLLSEGESIQMVKTNLELSPPQEHSKVIHRPPPAPNKFVTPFASSKSSISVFLRRNHSCYKQSRDYVDTLLGRQLRQHKKPLFLFVILIISVSGISPDRQECVGRIASSS